MLLGIDTSGAVSVALAEGTLGSGVDVRAVRGDDRARHHDEVLLALIEDALAEAGAQRSDLTGIVVGRGPGPFTGLRVGLVVARTLAAVLDLPLFGVVSLDALADEALSEDSAARTVGVALDARRREVYHARYQRGEDGAARRIAGPAVAPPADVAADLVGCDLLVGSGTALYPELLPATSQLRHVDAGHLLRVADALVARGEDLADTDPLYLRDPDAALPSARKSTLGR